MTPLPPPAPPLLSGAQRGAARRGGAYRVAGRWPSWFTLPSARHMPNSSPNPNKFTPIPHQHIPVLSCDACGLEFQAGILMSALVRCHVITFDGSGNRTFAFLLSSPRFCNLVEAEGPTFIWLSLDRRFSRLVAL